MNTFRLMVLIVAVSVCAWMGYLFDLSLDTISSIGRAVGIIIGGLCIVEYSYLSKLSRDLSNNELVAVIHADKEFTSLRQDVVISLMLLVVCLVFEPFHPLILAYSGASTAFMILYIKYANDNYISVEDDDNDDEGPGKGPGPDNFAT